MNYYGVCLAWNELKSVSPIRAVCLYVFRRKGHYGNSACVHLPDTFMCCSLGTRKSLCRRTFIYLFIHTPNVFAENARRAPSESAHRKSRQSQLCHLSVTAAAVCEKDIIRSRKQQMPAASAGTAFIVSLCQ
jgi:hypothetical protein